MVRSIISHNHNMSCLVNRYALVFLNLSTVYKHLIMYRWIDYLFLLHRKKKCTNKWLNYVVFHEHHQNIHHHVLKAYTYIIYIPIKMAFRKLKVESCLWVWSYYNHDFVCFCVHRSIIMHCYSIFIQPFAHFI